MFQHAQHITRLLGAPLCAALLLTAGCADEKTSAPPAAVPRVSHPGHRTLAWLSPVWPSR